MVPMPHFLCPSALARSRTLDDELSLLSEHPLVARQVTASIPEGMRQLSLLLDLTLDLRRDDLRRASGEPQPVQVRR